VLLCEIDHALEKQFAQTYMQTSFGETPAQYALYKRMMKKYPEYVYTGPMYRVVGIRNQKFSTFRTDEDVLRYIKRETIKRKATIQSWASTYKGVVRYNKLVTRRGISDTHVVPVLFQTATGFDLRKFSMEKGTHVSGLDNPRGAKIGVNHFAPSEQVYEVLSSPSNSITVLGYLHAGQLYTIKQIKKTYWHRAIVV